MFNRVRNAFFNVVGGLEPTPGMKDVDAHEEKDRNLSPKFPYTRPHFLQFHSEEEIQVSADHHIRPIIVPRDVNLMPWNAGYAETVNGGKSLWNEDQACVHRGQLTRPERCGQDMPRSSMPYTYFGIFDGHAGVGAAVAAANQLHHIIHEKLIDVLDHLLPPPSTQNNVSATTRGGIAMYFPEKDITKESLIVGALEAAFWDMDQLIGEDKLKYRVKGGCTALASLFIDGKLYIANAGDSRAVLCNSYEATPLSNDFTPESERQRVRQLAAQKPELLGGEYTHLDYCRRPQQNDLGKRILYRDWYMTGWGYKIVTPQDLKVPVVHGEGKRSRVLATIGVTRGFGDHDLKALYSNVPIKPFLMCQPEVRVVDLTKEENLTDNHVVVMGTDGLWDVTGNERAAEIVHDSFVQFIPVSDQNRMKLKYTLAAQDLVMQSRGKLVERTWRTSDHRAATVDDISVFVIPLNVYKKEHEQWLATVASHNENMSGTSGKHVKNPPPPPPSLPTNNKEVKETQVCDTAAQGVKQSVDITMEQNKNKVKQEKKSKSKNNVS